METAEGLITMVCLLNCVIIGFKKKKKNLQEMKHFPFFLFSEHFTETVGKKE